MDSILKYASDDELAAVIALSKKAGDAKAEGVRLAQESWKIKGRISARYQRVPNSNIDKARAYLGGAQPFMTPAAPEPVVEQDSLKALQEIEKGLTELLAENKDDTEAYQDAYRSAAFRLFVECAERAAEEYKTHAEELAQSWLMLSSADGLLRTQDHSFSIWPDAGAQKLLIPRNTSLRAMACAEAYTARQVLIEGIGMNSRIAEETLRLRAEAMGVFGSWPLN